MLACGAEWCCGLNGADWDCVLLCGCPRWCIVMSYDDVSVIVSVVVGVLFFRMWCVVLCVICTCTRAVCT